MTDDTNMPENAVLLAARGYISRGFFVVPIPPGGNRPLLTEWQERDYWEFAQACHEQLNFRNHGTAGVEFIPVASNEEFVCLADKLRYKAASLFRFILLEFNSIPFERLRKCKLLGCGAVSAP